MVPRGKKIDPGSEQELEFLRTRVGELESRLAKHLEAARVWQASERRYQALVENLQDLVWQLDPSGRILYLNPVWENLTGYTIEETIGRRFTEFQSAEASKRDLRTLADLLNSPGGQIRGYETVLHRKDGRPIHFLVNAGAVCDPEGRITGAYGTSTDITERRRLEHAEADRTGRIIRYQEALLQLVQREVDSLPNSLAAIARTASQALPVDRVGVWRFSPDRSELFCEVLHDEAPGRAGAQDRLAVSQFPAYFQAVERQRAIAAADVRTDPRTRDFLEVYFRPLGIGATLDIPVWRHERIEGIVCFDHVGGLRAWDTAEIDFAVSIADAVALVLETNERRRTEDQLRTIFRAIEQSPSVVTITDPEGRIQYVNPKFTEITGYLPEEVVGQNPRILKGSQNPPEVFTALWQAVKAGREWRGEFYNRKKNGETYVEQASISPIRGSDGSIVSIVKVAEDMTERKRMEEKLRRDATYDALTGVFNRRHVLEQLESAMESARRYRRPLSICLCDIDLFKVINDMSGHHVGDEVLTAFGGILRESLRAVDLAGRYGGDEFIMVFPDTRAADAAVSLERVRARFAALRIGPAENPIACSATFGLADFDPEMPDLKTLIARADQALYQAKAWGRNRLWIYGSEVPLSGLDAEATVRSTGELPGDGLPS